MVRRFDPRSVFIDAAGMPWAVYFLWQHNWVMALAAALLTAGARILATRNINVDEYSQTIMGRLALLHLRPANIVVQFLGIAVAVWALWAHSGIGLLSSLSLLFLGHLTGWDYFGVEKEFSKREAA